MAAEVGGDSGGKKGGKKGKPKKRIPRIDMTPMVDLAFLLLTFFILTTTLSTPQTMPVVVPPKVPDDKKNEVKPPEISEEKVLILLLSENDKIYWYQGVKDPQLQQTDYSDNGVRKVLMERHKDVKARFNDDLIVLIKIDDNAKYKNAVDILDEMNITEQKKYALVDITQDERELIKKYKEAMGGGGS